MPDSVPSAVPTDAVYRTFFDQATHFAGLMTLDGTMIDVNRVSLEAGGHRRDDIIGRRFWDCAWWRRSQAVMDEVRACTLRAAAGFTVRRELPYQREDERTCWTDIVFAPVTDAAGAVQYVAATGADITERRQVEARLRLLDAIGEATRVATDARAIMAEATRLLGEHLAVTRVAYADLEPDNDRFTIRHDWTVPGAISTAGVYSLDLFGSRATSNLRVGRTLLINDVDRELAPGDGDDMFNAIGIKAIICCPLVKGGALVAMMAVHQQQPRTWTADEIALVEAVVERCWAHIERVRSTEALHQADRHKSEFLATLAHELRNPLAPISNGLELLRLGAERGADMGHVREMMTRQVHHMVHLINDLLDIARVSSGKIVLRRQVADLKDVVASAVETNLPALQAPGHLLTVDLPDEPLLVDVDVVRMSQVLGNLLSNAAKYTPPAGRIAVAARRHGADVVITVSDNGIGIAAEALEAVFEMFTQVGRSVERSKGGLGIGLSLVRRLMALHGGSASASSAGEGQGSTFTLRLPVAGQPAHALPVAAQGAVPVQGTATAPLRVLIADDNVDAANTLDALLRLAGHDTRIAHDGVAALALAEGFRPQLAFLDLGMPLLDGYETARRLRALPHMADLALVALTGWGAAEDRARARAAGFDRHLLKPAAPDEVAAALALARAPQA
ncbi:hybrid sensor histidine kinase/response regulator [Pseudoduganella armeniaca]|uniref:histidine kinase n=1 Tax=Pseudoduganella armeniaca TaxID=2072590 RepID=A0A2R4C8Y8_9BURK|nr:ATP-binding protein [Pseudoduganella armeniaca]AVR96010.1 hybrid sensor histidine kinase/response regulator [Pseudoduganella armeniaca]